MVSIKVTVSVEFLEEYCYSKVPNKSTCTAIYFAKKVYPIQAY